MKRVYWTNLLIFFIDLNIIIFNLNMNLFTFNKIIQISFPMVHIHFRLLFKFIFPAELNTVKKCHAFIHSHLSGDLFYSF